MRTLLNRIAQSSATHVRLNQMLKRTCLLALVTTATSASFMNTPVEAQTATTANKLIVTVVKASEVIPNSSAAAASVNCPNNTIATGGGGEVSPNGLANAYLTSNTPIPIGSTTPTGWQIIGTNLSGGDLTFTAYALCARVK